MYALAVSNTDKGIAHLMTDSMECSGIACCKGVLSKPLRFVRDSLQELHGAAECDKAPSYQHVLQGVE